MYRLDCSCGAAAHVATRQAGSEVPCPGCGKALQVPQLRDLRKLPPATTSVAAESRQKWSPTRGWIFVASLLVAISCAVPMGIAIRRYVRSPPGMSANELLVESEKAVAETRAAELLYLWELYSESGLDPRRYPTAYQQRINRNEYFRSALLFAVPVLLSVGCAVAVAMAGSPKGTKA